MNEVRSRLVNINSPEVEQLVRSLQPPNGQYLYSTMVSSFQEVLGLQDDMLLQVTLDRTRNSYRITTHPYKPNLNEEVVSNFMAQFDIVSAPMTEHISQPTEEPVEEERTQTEIPEMSPSEAAVVLQRVYRAHRARAAKAKDNLLKSIPHYFGCAYCGILKFPDNINYSQHAMSDVKHSMNRDSYKAYAVLIRTKVSQLIVDIENTLKEVNRINSENPFPPQAAWAEKSAACRNLLIAFNQVL
jgi:hypothetical protein